jgi:hypothetical protein
MTAADPAVTEVTVATAWTTLAGAAARATGIAAATTATEMTAADRRLGGTGNGRK